MRKFLFILLMLVHGFSAFSALTTCVDFDTASAFRKIEFFNSTAKSIDLDAFILCSLVLNSGEKKTINAVPEFVFCDSSTGTLKIKNASDKSCHALITQKRRLNIFPGQRFEMTIAEPHCLSKLKGPENISWSLTEGVISVDIWNNSSVLAEARSLLLPSTWIERNNVFNSVSDFDVLLNKSKVSGMVPIKNNTSSPISVLVFGRKQTGEIALNLDIEPGETNIPDLLSYTTVKLNTGSRGFLDFCSTQAGYKISVEPNQMLLFPRPLRPFSFIPNRVIGVATEAAAGESIKTEEYWRHVGYMQTVVCRDERINPNDFFLQRQRLYEKFKIESIIRSSLPTTPRIPLNLFSIWLTTLSDPKEPDQELLDLAIESSKVNRAEEGWNYYFLVQDPLLLPKTVRALKDTSIKVVSFSELLGPLELESEFNEAVAARKFGMASDMLRVEALSKMGGGYLDIDLTVFHSLRPYFYLYNSLFGIEPMSEFLGNAFMAASKNHPIMKEMLRLMKRNFALKQANEKFFYSAIARDGFSTIVQTGPCVTTVAFYNAAGAGENVDVAMPPEAFYPARSLSRPEHKILTTADPVSLTAATLHLWLTSWAGIRGAKNGSFG